MPVRRTHWAMIYEGQKAGEKLSEKTVAFLPFFKKYVSILLVNEMNPNIIILAELHDPSSWERVMNKIVGNNKLVQNGILE